MSAFPTKVLVTYWDKEEGIWRKRRRLLDMGERGVIVDVSRLNDETHHIARIEFVYVEESV